MTDAHAELAELATALRPALLRLTRVIRAQRADMSITLTKLSALATLYQRGPMSAGELAAQERVQPPSMTKVIAGLEASGYVYRETDPADRRQSILAVTQAGADLLEEERRSRDAWLTGHLGVLTPAERNAIAAAIPALAKLADS